MPPLWKRNVKFSLMYEPMEKQKIFHQASQKFKTYAGGMGSGKTICGAAEAVWLSMEVPNNLGLIGRATYPELRDTTRKEILDFPVEVDGKEYRLVDSPIVKHFNKAENVIKFINGSEILFRSLEDAFDKVKSLNLGWFWVDELTEITEEMWLGLVGRLRRKGSQLVGYGTTNPEGHDWVWKRFVMNPGDDHFLISASSKENVFLPDGYVESMIAQYPDEWVQRYVYGSFDSFSGLIYKDFQDKEPWVFEKKDIPSSWYKFIGVDHGYRNPTCVLWGAVDPEGTIWVYDEFHARQMLVSEIANIILTKNKRQDIKSFLIDPSCKNRNGVTGKSVIDEFADNGIYFDGANNDVRAGINHVQECLKLGAKGLPKLRISRECVNLRQELQTYRWKDLRPSAKMDAPEKPLKKDDHAVDALRYMVVYTYDMPEVRKPRPSWKDWLMPDYGERKVQTKEWMAI